MRTSNKAEETGLSILNAALALFRQQGVENTTMREIAEKAGVATGAAYYYYPSKDAIVMDFYRRSSSEMQPKLREVVEHAKGLEAALKELIRVKLMHFAPNRAVLRALLRNGTDPKHPLSPFSAETRGIRDADVAWFGRMLDDCDIAIPRDLRPHLPAMLWFFQMGVIWFWVIDESPQQARTMRLLEMGCASAVALIRLSALPLMRPVRRKALQVFELIAGE